MALKNRLKRYTLHAKLNVKLSKILNIKLRIQ